MTNVARVLSIAVGLSLVVGACQAKPRIIRWHADSAPGGKGYAKCDKEYARLTAFVRDTPQAENPGVHELPDTAKTKVVEKLGTFLTGAPSFSYLDKFDG